MRANPGTFQERFGSLYLDPQGDGSGYVFAQQDDYALRVNIPGATKSSFNGTGVANGYTPNAVIPPFWDGVATTNTEVETVEWKASIGRFALGDDGDAYKKAIVDRYPTHIGPFIIDIANRSLFTAGN